MHFSELPKDVRDGIFKTVACEEGLKKSKEGLEKAREDFKRLALNPYFTGVMKLVQSQQRRGLKGFGGVDIIDAFVATGAAVDDDDDDDEFREDEAELYDEIRSMPYADKVSIIPALCSLGFWVQQFPESADECPMCIHFEQPRSPPVRSILTHEPTNTGA